MTTVLALDQASRTGWAVVCDRGVVAAGSWTLDDGIQTTGRRAVPLDVQHVLKVQRLRREIATVIARYGVDLVACERDFGRGAGTRLLVALYTAVQEAALDAALPCLGIAISSWRKEMHGTSRGSKDDHKSQAMSVCAELGIDVPDEDAAEAVQIARYVHRVVRVSEPTAPAMGRAA